MKTAATKKRVEVTSALAAQELAVRRQKSSMGLWHRNIRLYSGLILFTFATTHLINHALGLVSVEVMETMQRYRFLVWRSVPGTIVLSGALVLHIYFVLIKFVRRRSWKMSSSEFLQLTFGLIIPALLLPHILATRGSHELFGFVDSYSNVLPAMWSNASLKQTALVFLVWIHGCIGIHLWLRLKPWYSRCTDFLYAFAIILPVLAIAGFSVAGRQDLPVNLEENSMSAEERRIMALSRDSATWISLLVIGGVLGYRGYRTISDRLGPTVKVHYVDGTSVTSLIGPTLLDISRINGIPHASVCGGRARCSTCRVRIIEGLDDLSEIGDAESRVLNRVRAGANVRLACQLIPTSDIKVATLMPAQNIRASDSAAQDKYHWGIDQPVTVLFADIRGFTALSEAKLPYDVVFVLNQYLGKMAMAISDSGGYVDKFIGDGIMAIFGMEYSHQQGARDALRAAKAMSDTLISLNNSLANDLDEPLDIGIGIHTGPAILGRIGVAEVSGATQRITALGDTVNTASRLESSCKALNSQLIVSSATAEASGLTISGGRTELIAVKGREEKVAIHAFTEIPDMIMAETESVARR